MPIPVHIVTGEPGSGKSALIARLCDERPDWLGLVDRLPPGAPSNVHALAAGCPCCIGKVVLQITLARGLRQSRAVRAFVELAESGHLAGLQSVLDAGLLGPGVLKSRRIVLPRDRDLQVDQLAR